jgi:hypothetical protein
MSFRIPAAGFGDICGIDSSIVPHTDVLQHGLTSRTALRSFLINKVTESLLHALPGTDCSFSSGRLRKIKSPGTLKTPLPWNTVTDAVNTVPAYFNNGVNRSCKRASKSTDQSPELCLKNNSSKKGKENKVKFVKVPCIY